MKKPVPVVILSILAMLNGSMTFALGVLMMLWSGMLFDPRGYGPDRMAISQLFGSFAGQTGWIGSR